MTTPPWRRVLVSLAAWAVVAVPMWVVLFTHTSAPMVVAGHDVRVTPTFHGYAQLRTGPILPDVRIPTGGHLGVAVDVGKTTATSTSQLIARYAVIASKPGPEVRRVRAEVGHLAIDAAVRAAVLGLLPIGLWLLIGESRRRQLRGTPRRRTAGTVAVVVVLAVVLAEPWHRGPERIQPTEWISLSDAVPELAIPPELDTIEIQGGLITRETRRLVASAFKTYAVSKNFYEAVRQQVPTVASRFHVAAPEQTVGLLVSDRHDNIGMDPVAEAIAHAAGAQVVIDAGDDTSTGSSWEAFSLDSLSDAFAHFPVRLAISGNHDNGTFVSSYLIKMGWTHLEGKPLMPFSGVRILGVDDPRSSGLGAWLDETGLSWDQVKQRLADEVCRLDSAGERVATVVVHSASMALPALERGCTDLVVGGHLHRQVGPERIVGENGKVGYSYTNGTTGGAAYAFAMGSKLRRNAEVTLITWQDGRPVGLQPVVVNTAGRIEVHRYIQLDLSPARRGHEVTAR
ncbi:metallophosphoesterase [Nocardioides terrisoli]|uniref:metallophosphoesterase n=1 Tax=Nocardioides terrisoli TaxID=3388267 RepID=UPI00287BA887|nr:metallophosphoesterase [Nocardioides marmorisolisilvae]